MSDARTEILRRIGAALADVPAGERPQDVPVARDYRGAPPDGAAAGPGERERRITRFAARVRDYAAEVSVVTADEVQATVNRACHDWGLRRVAVAPALPPAWRPEGPEVIEDHDLSARQLDAVDGAVTGCATAIAETGTLVLDASERCGRRLLTLVPDHHICVVEADRIADGVPAALAEVATAVREHRRPITLISGPSASSDIELSRVEGVHGPRHLLVIVVD